MKMLGRLGLLALAGVAGCGGDDDEFSHYFAARPYTTEACNLTDAKLATHREIRLFTFGNADAPPYSRVLQRYYRRHGLQFYSHQSVTSITQRYVLDSDGYALNAGLAREFPGVDVSDEQALKMRDPALYDRVVKYTMNFIFRPIIEFARTYGTTGTEVTNLVVVPEIIRPGNSNIFGGGAQVAGLAVSPALIAVLAAQNTSDGTAWTLLDLPKEFSPMMFLDGKTLGLLLSAAPDLVDLVAAHEFGHTGGLVHRQEEHNLMLPAVDPTVSACTDSLDEDQLQTMRTTFGIGNGSALTLARPASAPHPASVLPPAELAALRRGDRAALENLVRRLY
jgi:hypothetical protein